ncbi:WXG100 family type VII secretion target [Anaeromicropila herbilytica]|uniref:ESAT-6-like protein n=1 Tax=Anaeromicropila herbilytica TaxID=2785025 RepID=A0A7R7EP26_9FIRM|nr:WXG100 family type VII secretion target [Anaeromicropila herbilytica]BCN32352.1 hypothetical protein bsdtb5_36470 [Anaeromicropila herbilytica]
MGNKNMHLETKYLKEANKEFEKALKELTDIKIDIEQHKRLLYTVWVGKSRDEFEYQYNILFNKISDIKDALDDMYDMMVNAQAKYDEVDDDIRQKIVMSSK